MAPVTISKATSSHRPTLETEIEEKLLRSLAGLNVQSKNESIIFSAQDENNELIGGVTGSTSYGWLLVKLLWVSNHHRGQGIGKDLMLAIEQEARALNCHSAWLDTSNGVARDFYLRLGYEDFGVLENKPSDTPADHSRWFMKKRLDGGSTDTDIAR
ncbi:MAG: GNAT family N-acetyltransferase [Hyphomicrobiales bacterium]